MPKDPPPLNSSNMNRGWLSRLLRRDWTSEVQRAIVREVQRVRVDPGDTLVVSISDELSHEEIIRVRDSLSSRFSENSILLLTGGATLSVLSTGGGSRRPPAEMPPRPEPMRPIGGARDPRERR